MAGFTTEYDGDGNVVGFSTREQELQDIFQRDGSFGFGGGYEEVKTSAMRVELARLMKVAMSMGKLTGILENAAAARGFVAGAKPTVGQVALPVLAQMKNVSDPNRKRELARSAISFLRGQPKVRP